MAERLLWLLRHAKTVPDPPAGGTDHDRPLAPRGRRDADALARRLGSSGDRLGIEVELPEVVLCSTATRTVQTTERVLADWPDPPPEVRHLRSLYGADPEGVLGELALLEPTVRSAMVVGHNPTAHSLAEELLAPGDGKGHRQVAAVGFPTCALAVYRWRITRWEEAALGRAALVGLFRPPY